MRVFDYALYFCILTMLSLTPSALAHELPERVQTRILVEETSKGLRVFIRVPLEAMRDFDFPTRETGYLDITKAEPLLRDAATLWVADEFDMFANGQALAVNPDIVVRVSLPTDRSFDTVETANVHMTKNLGDETLLYWRQASLDILMTYSLGSEVASANRQEETLSFAIDSRLGHLGLRTSTSLTFINRYSEKFYYDFAGSPGLLVLAPDWYQVATEFVERGVIHIWEGIDHILFLFCLILPIRQIGRLVWVISAFTVGHSITLSSAALGFIPDFIWFPSVIEFLIALSIVVMALDNILGERHQRRWLYGFCFGLIHGFGFSFALAESLQFSGSHLLVALTGFNFGVEIGQLLLLGAALPLLWFAFRVLESGEQRPKRQNLFIIVLSVIIAHTALHWLSSQWQLMSGYF